MTLLAPGGDPKTTDENGHEAYIWTSGVRTPEPARDRAWYGTESAAAHVSGAIALALTQHPEWRGNADIIEQKLRGCAVPPLPMFALGCGSGQLDAARLVDGTCATSVSESASASAPASPPPAPAVQAAAPVPAPAPSPAPAPVAVPVPVPSQTSAAAPPQAPENPIAGQWFLPDGDGILVISAKGEWLHPKHGVGRVREANDEADIKVFYNNSSIRCAYRISFSDGGKTFILSPADATQDPAYCPSGELKSAAH